MMLTHLFTVKKANVISKGKAIPVIGCGGPQGPHKPSRYLAQETGVSLGSVFLAKRLIKFHPYKITTVHKLKQYDYAVRILFCKWMLENVYDGAVDPQLL
jgi:hypothetical protein